MQPNATETLLGRRILTWIALSVTVIGLAWTANWVRGRYVHQPPSLKRATRFEDDRGQLSIDIPGEFTVLDGESTYDRTDAGKLLTISHTATFDPTHTLIQFSFTDYPEAYIEKTNPSAMLNKLCEQSLSSISPSQNRRTSFVLPQGYEGREIYFYGIEQKMVNYLGEPFAGRSKLILVKNRLYRLSAIARDQQGIDSPQVRAVFDSIALHEPNASLVH